MTSTRGFPIIANKFWGGKMEVCGYTLGVVPHTGAPHLEHLECTGAGLAQCLCCRSSYKDGWHCGDEGTSPFNYFIWCLNNTTPEDKYPLNSNMSIKGMPMRGCFLIIKLDAAPSHTAKPIDITLEEVEAIVAANPLPDPAPEPEPVARSAPTPVADPTPAPAARAAPSTRRRRKKQ